MFDYLPVNFPVGGIDGFGPAPAVSGWLFAPRDLDPAKIRHVAFCIHGGGYDKRYFHIEAPGRDGYSLCRHFADRGVIAVTIDCLGTGESSQAERAEFVTSRRLAKAHHVVATQLMAWIKAGRLTPELPPLPHIALTGIGHSLGGLLTIVQQAAHRSFDRVAILGWSNLGLNLDPAVLKPVFDPTGTYAYSSPELRRAFHLSDVPADVLDCPAEREVFPVSLSLAARGRRPRDDPAVGGIDRRAGLCRIRRKRHLTGAPIGRRLLCRRRRCHVFPPARIGPLPQFCRHADRAVGPAAALDGLIGMNKTSRTTRCADRARS